MLKFPVSRGILTLKSSKIIPIECAAVLGPEGQPPAAYQAIEERIKVAINPEYLEQTIMIRSTLTEEGQNKLCDLLQRNLDVFAWRHADMIGIPRHIAEHRLNIREGCPPVRQKRRNLKDLNKACMKDGPLPEIDWKVESLCKFPFTCFLDAYKGYHQIKMAKKDEEKTAFIISQGIFCYSKMPFSLRNAGVTYQHLVDKAFHKKIGRNLKVYVDDLIVKSRMEDEIIRDIEETFKTLREINMKLNPKKCTFGVEEGMFLGYKVNTKGIMVCPEKVDAILSLPSLKCLKDIKKLNGKLASLNRFLAKSAEKSLPFFKTPKKCTKKSDFHWTKEAESVFKQMTQLIEELPTLTTPEEKEELIVYLAATKEAVSAVLMTEREAKQMPIYFVSRALRGPEVNYTSVEKLILALVHASKRLKRYFQAHPIIVVTDQPIKQILLRPEVAGRLQKWSIELGEYAIHYRLRVSVMGQILADFIVKHPEEDSLDTPMAGLILTNLEGAEFTNTLRFIFEATNNEAEYEALIVGLMFSIKQVPRSENKKADALSKITSTSFAHLSKLVLVEELKEKSVNEVEVLAVVEEEGNTWVTLIYEYLTEGTLPTEVNKARVVRRKSHRFTMINGIHEGSCSMNACTRSVVAKALRTGYYWPTMHKDTRALIRACQDCQVHRPILRNPQQKLTPLMSPWPFYKWGIDIAGPFPEGPGKVKFLIVAIDYFTKWIEAKPVTTITVVIPAEIGMPTLRTAKVDMVQNDEALEINLDLLEERREQAAIHEAKSKAKMEKYYNSKVRSTSFKPGDLVYRSNDASCVEELGKLGPKWEGPYKVTEALGKGAYKLRDRDGKQLSRT
ncbi:reverse transcriptase domain-containing protein [Tanacetum coccineum]